VIEAAPAVGYLLAAFIGVSLGFFGGGGSILTVPLLVYVFGLDPKVAIASSLLIVAIASSSGALQHARAGNLRVRTGLLFGSAGMMGAYLGGRASAFLDGGVLLLLFACMMALTSVTLWRGRRTVAPSETSTVKLCLQGLAVGLFTGLVGAGGGFLIVPALVLWAGLPMTAAIGTSLMIIVMNSTAGFLGYLSHVDVDFALVAGVGACAIGGSFAGSRLTRVVSPDNLRRAFAGFVLAMAVTILVREGSMVVLAAREALPHTLPQLLFALLVLGVGVLAGRASRSAKDGERGPVVFDHGAGI
jgi:uncharacterized membrane protein YfcA